jgi:hypothetical protein
LRNWLNSPTNAKASFTVGPIDRNGSVMRSFQPANNVGEAARFIGRLVAPGLRRGDQRAGSNAIPLSRRRRGPMSSNSEAIRDAFARGPSAGRKTGAAPDTSSGAIDVRVMQFDDQLLNVAIRRGARPRNAYPAAYIPPSCCVSRSEDTVPPPAWVARRS